MILSLKIYSNFEKILFLFSKQGLKKQKDKTKTIYKKH